MQKTSESHPLRIDAVSTAGGGRIGMTLCPGKVQSTGFAGPWQRDLETDIAAIRNWGSQILVSLMEGHELRSLSVPGLGARAEAAGLEWHHLPIPDGGVPDAAFEARWVYAGHRLRRELRAGRSIVLHCMGGLGRTGTIAGRLLVELGQKPMEAMSAVRRARPGTVETSAQERYLLDRRPLDVDDAYVDRVLGCILGGAVGDALGYAVEFDSLAAIRARHGAQGITAPVASRGRYIVSDDTQMTLFTLEGLLRACGRSGLADGTNVVEEIRRAYLDWLDTQGAHTVGWRPAGVLYRDPVLRARRAPGGTCLSALQAGGSGRPDRPINNSKGCGGVMRVAPIGLVRAWSPSEAFDLAARAAALTHGHPSGWLSAGAVAAMIRLMLDGAELPEAAGAASSMADAWPDCAETVRAIQDALDAAVSHPTDHPFTIQQLGEGWVGEEALAIGLYAALVGRSFPEVLSIATNHSGDSDSTASIAGQLYGAWRGVADLPHAWTMRLDVLEPAVDLLGGLLALERSVTYTVDPH